MKSGRQTAAGFSHSLRTSRQAVRRRKKRRRKGGKCHRKHLIKAPLTSYNLIWSAIEYTKEKWWITASDILKDHSSEEWIHRTNKNPTKSEIGNRKDAGWGTGWDSPLPDHRINQIVEEGRWEVSFERSRNPEKQTIDPEKAPESAA